MKHLIIAVTCLLVTAGCITLTESLLEQQCMEYAERLFPDQTPEQRELICEWLAGMGARTIEEFCERNPDEMSGFNADLYELMCSPSKSMTDVSAELAVRLGG